MNVCVRALCLCACSVCVCVLVPSLLYLIWPTLRTSINKHNVHAFCGFASSFLLHNTATNNNNKAIATPTTTTRRTTAVATATTTLTSTTLRLDQQPQSTSITYTHTHTHTGPQQVYRVGAKARRGEAGGVSCPLACICLYKLPAWDAD